jgi:hypothetical protein
MKRIIAAIVKRIRARHRVATYDDPGWKNDAATTRQPNADLATRSPQNFMPFNGGGQF